MKRYFSFPNIYDFSQYIKYDNNWISILSTEVVYRIKVISFCYRIDLVTRSLILFTTSGRYTQGEQLELIDYLEYFQPPLIYIILYELYSFESTFLSSIHCSDVEGV